MSTNDTMVAETILSQLGGLKVLRAMIGMTHALTSPRALDIRFTAKNVLDCNHVRIELNARDTYDLTFYRIRQGGLDCKEVGKVSDVDAEDLIETFCGVTGLDLCMPRVVGLNA